MTSLEKLKKHFLSIYRFQHLESMVHWDDAVNMPAGGGAARSAALAELAVHIHSLLNDKGLKKFLEESRNEVEKMSDGLPKKWELANLRETERVVFLAQGLPASFVEKKSLALSKCEKAWRDMRAANNWKDFAPYMEEVFNITKEEGKIRSQHSGLSPYDSLLDLYSPGLASKEIDGVFEILKQELPVILNRALEVQAQKKRKDLTGQYAVYLQKELGLRVMELVGFDFNHGRLDVSHHPFCGGVPEDVRITTRYLEDNFFESLMGVIHESGHAKYEQNLPKEWAGLPVGNARGMAVHESQSLFLEMQIGRSLEFFKLIAPIVRESFRDSSAVKNIEAEDLYSVATKVEKSFIRVGADEVTYPFHVILRYEIEKSLMSGEITVQDIPAVWNEKMQQYLGLSTKGNDKDGCMQDVHWPSGAFGYFPSYTFGAMIAAQLKHEMKEEIAEFKNLIVAGDFTEIDQWMRERVWSRGCFHTGEEFLMRATGEDLNPEHFLSHLSERYL